MKKAGIRGQDHCVPNVNPINPHRAFLMMGRKGKMHV